MLDRIDVEQPISNFLALQKREGFVRLFLVLRKSIRSALSGRVHVRRFPPTALFVKDHEDAPVALVLFVARILVICADVNLASGDRHIAVALRANLRHPLEVFGAPRIDFLGAGLEFNLAIDRLFGEAVG